MKRRIILSCFIVAVMALTSCEPETFDTFCSIKGVVVEEGSNEPLQDVTVTIIPEKRNTTTGTDGTFYFQDLDASYSKFTIQAQKDGYETCTLYIHPIAGETLTVSLTLPLIPHQQKQQLSAN